MAPYDEDSADDLAGQSTAIVCDLSGNPVNIEAVQTIDVQAQQVEPQRLAQIMARLPCADSDNETDEGDQQLQFTLVRCLQYLKAVETVRSCFALCREFTEQELAPVQVSLDRLSSDAHKIGGQSEAINAQFESAIEQLKNTALDEKIAESVLLNSSKSGTDKAAKPATLMDIYYKEEKLKAWRDSCLKSILNLQKKLAKI